MENLYGEGYYVEGKRIYRGQIIIDDFKLFLRDKEEDFVDTYMPLEKIEKIRKTRQGIEVKIKLSGSNGYTALLKGQNQQMRKMLGYLVKKLNMKRRFLKNEWLGEVAWR